RERKQVKRLPELQSVDARRFEFIVQEIYRTLGWEVKATKFSGDNGVDGFLQKVGKLFVLQCKRFGTSQKVGSPLLRDLLGTSVAEGAVGGILVTTSTFSKETV